LPPSPSPSRMARARRTHNFRFTFVTRTFPRPALPGARRGTGTNDSPLPLLGPKNGVTPVTGKGDPPPCAVHAGARPFCLVLSGDGKRLFSGEMGQPHQGVGSRRWQGDRHFERPHCCGHRSGPSSRRRESSLFLRGVRIRHHEGLGWWTPARKTRTLRAGHAMACCLTWHSAADRQAPSSSGERRPDDQGVGSRWRAREARTLRGHNQLREAA